MMLVICRRHNGGSIPSIRDIANGTVNDGISRMTRPAQLHAHLRSQAERVVWLEDTVQRYSRIILELLTQASRSLSTEAPQLQASTLPLAAQTLYAALNPQSTAIGIADSAESPSQLPLLAASHPPQPHLLMQSRSPAQAAVEQFPQIVRPHARVGGPLPPSIHPGALAGPGVDTSRSLPVATSPQPSALPLHAGPSETYQQGFRPLSSQRSLAKQPPPDPASEPGPVEGLPWNTLPPYMLGSPQQRGFSGGPAGFQAASGWQPGRAGPPPLPLPPDQPHLPNVGLALNPQLLNEVVQAVAAQAPFQQMFPPNPLQQILSHFAGGAVLTQGPGALRSLGEAATGAALPAQAPGLPSAQASALASAVLQQQPATQVPGFYQLLEALASQTGSAQAPLPTSMQQVLPPSPS